MYSIIQFFLLQESFNKLFYNNIQECSRSLYAFIAFRPTCFARRLVMRNLHETSTQRVRQLSPDSKNNSRRITYGIGCVWGMPSLSPLSSLEIRRRRSHVNIVVSSAYMWISPSQSSIISSRSLQTETTKTGSTKRQQNTLQKNSPKPGRFYTIPKIHKPGNPGRPVVSNISHPTEWISLFIDFHLQPLVTKLPSYTTNKKLNNIG